ncbi:MAG: glycosyltransferase 87 family protein [Cyanobacteria bacterium P01_B01_bin.77]
MNAKVLSLVLLVFISLNTWVERLPLAGIDFYHYWGVTKAQQLSPTSLQNPYASTGAYANVLNQHAATTDDQILQAANAYRRTLDLTGTPLLYTAFAFLPKNYSLAIKGFRLVQLVLFVAAIFVIGRLRGGSRGFTLLAIVLSITFSPFLSDVAVGNLNAIQLFWLAISTLLVEQAQPQTPQQQLRFGVIALCSFIFLTLFKPNLLLPLLLLGIVFIAKYGLPRLAVLVPTGVLFTALLVVVTNLCLGSSHVWLDWYSLVSASQERLAYPIAAGNYSTTLLLSQLYDIDIYAAVTAVASFLVISFASVVMLTAARQEGKLLQKGWHICLNLLQNSGFIVSSAVTITFALSPLLWAHYYTLMLLPTLWLMDIRRPWCLANCLSLLAVLCSGGILVPWINRWLELTPELYAASFMVSWVWVWSGLMVTVLNLPARAAPANP